MGVAGEGVIEIAVVIITATFLVPAGLAPVAQAVVVIAVPGRSRKIQLSTSPVSCR
jgi:hypothetical protein